VEHSLNDHFVQGPEMGCWALEYLTSGRTIVETAGKKYSCRAPSVLLAPPHAAYSVTWAGGAGPWGEIYAIFAPPSHWNALLLGPARLQTPIILDLPDSPVAEEIEAALRSSVEAQLLPRMNRELWSYNALEKALLLLDEVNPLLGRAPREERIEKALWYIASHYQQPIDLEVLAKQVFLSPSRFSHLFRLQMEQTPMHYLEEYRLDRAAEKLLSTHDSVEQVAHAVGFSNAFHFSTRFRKRFRQSPSRFRLNPEISWNTNGN
jgi:AraC family transcriptional regulator of arabinose operon